MKNNKKISVLAILSLAVALPLTVSASATTDVKSVTADPGAIVQPANGSSDVNTPKADDHVITPQSTQPAFDTTLSGQQTVSYFSIPAGLGYVKLWVRNTGSEAIKFAVHKGSASGSVMSGTDVKIAPGDTFSWISSSAWSTGEFYATFNTSNTKMSGQAYGKLASSRSEL
ncbi:hypothetical protein [Paenibacillus sp. 23TSA30-6]|uniref:hypothetical protein n=1 Tax=Paenibacillus sp. 23TSA30-6 TaxID=2546104 RepID=UPI0017884379|nr:hypothetical protein [Paenibacillus sp. 23TSA30-6]MBE0338659.1 hypothetical protein [Paenibacillus sp. 23TSA30-6]